MDKAKISVIIPVYKVEQYLRNCIESVINQTYTNWELIMVDDGSPDNCPKICDEYAKTDERIKVIHQKNSGQACARNAAIKMATGEYVLCLDGDDYYAGTDVLQSINQNTLDNPDVVIFGYKKLFESDGTFGGEVFPSFKTGEDIEIVLLSQLKDNSYGGQAWTKAVRRELLIDNSIEFRKGMVGQACGTPVITYEATGSKETVDGECGFAVETGNAKRLFECVELIKRNTKAKYSAACRRWIENNFKKENNYQLYLDLYKEIVHKNVS